jgi:hypothetical protein
MKHIAFHSNQLGIAGTEVALYDYALYNEEVLGNKSYIISDNNANLDTKERFEKRFEVFLYNDFKDCFEFVKTKNIEYVYYIKYGTRDEKIVPGVKNLIHVVFPVNEPHGDKYVYVSPWLANTMGSPGNYVPHIVNLPQPTFNYRKQLSIPEQNLVIGRHGGYSDFDLPFVYQSIYSCLEKRKDITFLFMNTKPFGPPHPNIIFINKTTNLQNKANFIDTCDYMIHGRNYGESFGLAICEFLFGGKPVIAWSGGLNKNYIELLGDKGIWYSSYEDLTKILLDLTKPTYKPDLFKELVSPFTPNNVMQRFNEVFLI